MSGGIFDELFSEVQNRVAGYVSVATEILTPWMRRAAMRLGPVVERERRIGGPCEVPAFVDGSLCKCRADADIRCAACRRRSCLGHAFVSHQAEALCWQCVKKAVQSAPPPVPKVPQQRAARHSRDDIREARDILGVTALETTAEVKKAYRILMKKWHPDIQTDPKKKSSAEAKCVRITAAYNVLVETENGSNVPS